MEWEQQESSAPHQDPGRDWPGVLPPPPGTEHGAPTLLGFWDHGEIPPWLQTPSREVAWDTLPSPTSSIIPTSQRTRLVPREGAPGDMGGVIWEDLCYFLSGKCSGCGSPSRGAPQSLMAETPPRVWSSQMAPGKHVLRNLQSSGARPWKSKPVPGEGPSLPRAPPPPTSGAPGQLPGRAQQSASAWMHLPGSQRGLEGPARPL